MAYFYSTTGFIASFLEPVLFLDRILMWLEKLPFVPAVIDYECQIINDLTKKVAKQADEIIDIFNKTDTQDGGMFLKKKWSMEKDEAHEKWELHLTTHVWLYNSIWEILIQKRAQTVQIYPGLLFLSAGWHIQSWETIEEGTVREVAEEIGLKIDMDNLLVIDEEYKNILGMTGDIPWHNHELSRIYIAKYEGDFSKLERQESEVEKLVTMHIDDFEKELSDSELSKKFVPKKNDYYSKLISAIRSAITKESK